MGNVTGVKIDKEIMIPIIIFIAVLIFAVLLFFVSKNIARKKASTAEPLTDEAKKMIEPKKVTLTPAALGAAADKLFIAMRGFGTDEKQIYEVFKALQTESDLMALIVAFGKRKSYNFYDGLPAWIADECSQGEIDTINKILADKGINFKF